MQAKGKSADLAPNWSFAAPSELHEKKTRRFYALYDRNHPVHLSADATAPGPQIQKLHLHSLSSRRDRCATAQSASDFASKIAF